VEGHTDDVPIRSARFASNWELSTARAVKAVQYLIRAHGYPPKHIAAIPIFADPSGRPHPGWITFSLDGRFAYPDGGVVIDTETKKVIARIPTTEKLMEIDFEGGKPVAAGHR
jgi:hypothetical protein